MRQGDIQIRIAKVVIGKVALTETYTIRDKGPLYSKEKFLSIQVEINNQSETKKVDYKTWAGDTISWGDKVAVLSDEYDNNYQRVNFGFANPPVGRVDKTSIRPGKTVTDILVFELPVSAAQVLRLELPAGNFGGEGRIRLEIPQTMVEQD